MADIRSSDEDWCPEEMAVRASHGDISAFEALYERYNGYVRYTALRILRSQQDAEDVAQNVWSKLLLDIEKYIPGARFTTWLYSVATHAAIDHRRRIKMNREVSLESIEDGAGRQTPYSCISAGGDLQDQETDLLFKCISKELGRAQTRLRNRNQAMVLCFRLYYFYGFSVKEIAYKIRIPEGTVKSHLYLSRKYLEEKHPSLLDLHFALQKKQGIRIGRFC